MPPREAPVILLTGTPGTGKSTTAQLLSEESPIPLKHINVGDLVKEKDLHDGYDPEWQSFTVNEDKVRLPYDACHESHLISQLSFSTSWSLLLPKEVSY
jgi:broad-specificity NMP kinase